MEPTDGELARRVQAQPGDRAAEAALCARFARRAFLYGLKHLRDEAAAQDLAQEVLITVLAALREGRVDDPERVASFVLGTCRLTVAGWRRRERRRQELAAGLPVETAFEDAHADVAQDQLVRCFERLAPREQRLITMTFHDGAKAEQIAAALGLSAGNVRVLRHRVLSALRTCVERPMEVPR